MKNLSITISLILLVFVFSCSDDLDMLNPNFQNTQQGNGLGSGGGNGGGGNGGSNANPSAITFSSNELVIQYRANVSPNIKASLRSQYGISSYEICQKCPDGSIEKWIFGPTINIEPLKKVIEGKEKPPYLYPIKEVDLNFRFILNSGDMDFESDGDMDFESHVKSYNHGLTIAIIDTGFDPDFSLFDDVDNNPIKMLYTPTGVSIEGEISGWNFAEGNNLPYDDDTEKHGTVISEMIFSSLKSVNIPHQILPIKVANALGQINYFELVCSFKYSIENSDMINMSLGWQGYGAYENTIFLNLLQEHPDVMVITSAGNTGDDNDDTPHFPSSFNQHAPNVIAVASTNKEVTNIASFSNYGATHVDFFAVGAGIPFYTRDGELLAHSLQGTSFAAPQVTAIVAKYIYTHSEFTATSVRNALNTSGIHVPHYSRPVKYNKLLLGD